MQTIVLKFGGASVATIHHFLEIAKIIASYRAHYPRVIVVVSAMGDTTDHLLAMAKSIHPTPPQREHDMLLSVGERISAALLAMQLSALNHPAISFTGSQAGIITCCQHMDAKILQIKPHRLLNHLENGSIVIVAGFQGVSLQGDITTLGRGGSDTTAVALALALGAQRALFFKDVPGIFDRDPHTYEEARQFDRLTYEEAYNIVEKGAQVLHPRAVRLAAKNYLPLQVLSFKDPERAGTLIQGPGSRTDQIKFEDA